MKLNTAEVLTAKNIAKQDERLNYNLIMLFGRIIYLINRPEKEDCYAHNSYFAKQFNRSERTIQLWLKTLKEFGYITVKYRWQGTKIVKRIIDIPAELIAKVSDEMHKKTCETENSVGKPNFAGNCAVNSKVNLVVDVSSNEDTYTRVRARKTDSKKSSEAQNTTNSYDKESYWQLIDRKIPVFNLETSQLNELIKQHTKQRMLFRKAPTNYALELTIDSLFDKFRSMKNRIKAVEKAVKNGWINIGGGVRNKPKKAQQTQNTTVYDDILPDLSYTSWADIL